MIIDALLLFSYNQSMAQAVGSYDSTNIIDIGVNNGIPGSAAGGGARDLSIGDKPLICHFSTPNGFTSGGAATIQVTIQGAPDNGFGAPGAFYALSTSPPIPVANIAAVGRVWDQDLPRVPVGAPIPRFLKATYTIAGAAMTQGIITGEIVLDRSAAPSQQYPEGITTPN